MSKKSQWLLYGASGFSGLRIAKQALAMGYAPVLAGRNEIKLKAVADSLGVKYEVFGLDDADTVVSVVSKYSVVLNCAGPFGKTYTPLIEACLQSGTHYLDITGEVDVYEGLFEYNEQAKEKNIMIMPGVGFDMVPGDCLALMLKQRMPNATELDVGYSFDGVFTQGSIRSALASFSPNSKVRRNNKLTCIDAPLTQVIDFGPHSQNGEVECLATTFGDVSIGWRTSCIPNVTAYLHMTSAFVNLANVTSEEAIRLLPEGPSDTELATEKAFIVGTVKNMQGEICRARMTTPQVYAATFPLAASIAQRVSTGEAKPGFQTPAAIFGADFVLDFKGFDIEWLT